jgi:hypothetical protein
LLDNVCVDFSILDCLPRFGHGIESDDLDTVGFPCLLGGRERTECGIVIDPEDCIEVGIGLQDILSGAMLMPGCLAISSSNPRTR